MRCWSRFAAIGVAAFGIMMILGAPPASARAHVYLFRGLADVYSLGMNTLAEELNARGVDATAHSHTDWKPIADKAAAACKAGKEGPIILIGHSLGADAVMEMADYLGDKGVPVALVVPVDGTQSFPVPGNVGRALNFTQRDYAHMRPGPGFRGGLTNVDLSADKSIDHFTIDKSPRLHARVISEVLAIVGGHGAAPPASPKPASTNEPAAKGMEGHTPIAPAAEGGAGTGGTSEVAPPPSSPQPQKPAAMPRPVHPAEQIPD